MQVEIVMYKQASDGSILHVVIDLGICANRQPLLHNHLISANK